MEPQQQPQEQKKGIWYNKYYKILLVIPVIIMLLSLVYLGFFFSKHKDFMLKDASLSGGTTITLNGDIDTGKLETELKIKFSDLSVRKLTDLRTGKLLATVLETSAPSSEFKETIESILGYKLNDENSSTEFSGPTLSENFYKQVHPSVQDSIL